MMNNEQIGRVSRFILEEVERHPADLVAVIADAFGFTRQRAHYYVSKEVKRGTLIKTGATRSTRYFLRGGSHIEFSSKVDGGIGEDVAWSRYIKPMVTAYPDNVRHICHYGFTEIFNNALDHSDGTQIFSEATISDGKIEIIVMDNGVGIFEKIKKALNLETAREAILHLSKGKFTTDPSKHTGEGIFFTSRAFDSFSISSGDMFYTFAGRDWFLSPEKSENFGSGTYVKMLLRLDSGTDIGEIMHKFADHDIGFTKTVVAVALSADENDPHISRSQAKRLILGLEKFKSVLLDFTGVSSVGQAFVDEVFRVFRNEYPHVAIRYCSANDEVEAMIRRGVPDAGELRLG